MKRLISSILVIALMLTMLPVAFAASTDFELKLGDVAAYTVEPNGTVDVPVYFKTSDGVTDKLGTLQTYVVIPEGFTAEVVAGSLGANALSVDAANGIVKAMGIIGDGYTNDTPAFTIKFTASATEGDYAVAYSTAKKYATKLYNRETLEKFDAARYTLTETSITVREEETPVEPPVEPPVLTTDFELKLGAQSSYTVEPNGTVDVPVYFITAAGVTDKLGTLQTYVVIPEGFTAEVVAGSLGANALSVDAANGIVKAMGIIGDGYTNDTPAFTIKFTASSTAGDYAVAYSTAKKYVTKLYNRETLEKFDAARYTLTETSITVTAGETPVVPTLTGITVDPVAFEVPYGADALTAVKAAITAVTATYSDNTTATVTDYTVALDGADKAVVTYEGKTAEIALTYEPAPVVLTDIAVDPSVFEVPYGTVDVLEAVKGAITTVVAKYSDGSTAPVTDYTVALDGADKAVVTYEGKTAEIALTYESAPVEPPVLTTDFELKLGAQSSYTVEAGQTVDIPVYFITAAGVTDKLGTLQTYVVIPEGFTAEVVAGSLGANALSVDAANGIVKAMGIIGDGYTNDTPAFTIKFTASSTAGDYAVAYSTAKKYVTKLYNRETLEKFDAARYTLTETSITVTAGETPVEPTLESITVNPTAVEVPYGVDAKVAVEDAITGVTAVYSDGTTGTVTGWSVEIDGDKAIVTYEGKTAEIALTFAQPPVTDVEIIVAVNSIVVPYNITVPVETYAVSQVGEVKVKNSEGAERVVEAQITYDAAESVVVVAYADLTPVKIPVTVITLVDYTIGGITGVIEIPYDCADPAGYVKGIITVTANLSDGSTMEIPYFTVEVNADWTAADVLVNGEKIEVVDTKKGAEPVTAITGIKVEVADAIVVPYGTDDVAAYIKSKIVVKTVDEDGVEAAISDYTVVANDGYADIAYGEFTESVDFTVETAELKANVTAIEIPYTVAEADYAAYIAQNVALTIDYSANTADKPVVATAEDVVIDVDVAIIRIEGLVVEVQFTVQAAPEYIATAVPAYGLAGKVLVKITGVADGKIAVVNGLEATYFGNGNFAVVVDEAYTVELVAAAAMPVAAEFGKLHPAGVTAWDALVTNDEALEKDVEVFEDIQMYVIADLDGNGKIEAIDALNINKISLFQGSVAVPTWVDAE